MKLSKNSGLTLIETLIASFILAFVLTGVVNLATKIYSYTFLTKLKTYSFNLAVENLEIMKTYNFGALKLTPDSMLPDPLSKLENNSNPWGNPVDPDNIVPVGGVNMRVYKYVQNAQEDELGNITGFKQSELPVSNLKKITVAVIYEHSGPKGLPVGKKTELTSIISNAETSFGGVTIKGRVQKREKTNGNVDPPGFAAVGYVIVEGHPEYTAVIGNDSTDPQERGYYTIYGVMPGTYILRAMGDGFESSYYVDNPLVVDVSSGDINGINFTCPREDPSSIAGTIYDQFGNTVNSAEYKIDGQEIRADDGQSTTTTVQALGKYLISNIDPDALSVSVTAVFTKISTGATYFGQYPARVNIAGSVNVTNINITIMPITSGGIVRVKTLDARDLTTPITNVNISFTDIGTGAVTTLSSGGTGDVTAVLPALGNYLLSGAKSNYSITQNNISVSVTNNTPLQKLYFFPCGSISGIIIESITGLPPTKPISIQAFSDYLPVGGAFSNTTTGQYQIDNVHTGSRNKVRIYVDGTSYELYNPQNGVIEPVTVSFGSTTADQNFTITTAYKSISGSLNLSSRILNDGVLIVAQPDTNTVTPHMYSLDNSNTVYKAQNALRRRLNPVNGIMAERNGTYKIMVPDGETYNIYGYYTTVSYPAGTLYRYYKILNGVAPGSSNQNFSGTWTQNY